MPPRVLYCMGMHAAAGADSALLLALGSSAMFAPHSVRLVFEFAGCERLDSCSSCSSSWILCTVRVPWLLACGFSS